MENINLIPADRIFLLRWNGRRILVFFVSAAIIGLSGLYLIQEHSLKVFRGRMTADEQILAGLKVRQSQMSEILAGIGNITDRKNDMHTARDIVRQYLKGRVIWSSVISDLTAAAGRDIWLDDMQVLEAAGGDNNDRKKILELKLEGWSLTPRELAGLVTFMEEYPLFDKVALAGCELEMHGGRRCYRFEIDCEVAR